MRVEERGGRDLVGQLKWLEWVHRLKQMRGRELGGLLNSLVNRLRLL